MLGTIEIGTKFVHESTGIECEVIQKVKDGFACTYILRDVDGATFSVYGNLLRKHFKQLLTREEIK